MKIRERKSQNPCQDTSEGDTNYVEQPLLGMQNGLIIGVVAVRLLNIFFPITSFVPDEYWQALEVAHRLAFGYGHLTWEWSAAVRGYSYPLLFAGLYKILALLNMDSCVALLYFPQIVHLPLAILNDVFVFKLTNRLYGPKVAQYALIANLLSWFTFYCVTRTLSNSVETCFTAVILYYWMAAYESKSKNTVKRYARLYLLLVGVSVLIRPTGVLMWAPLVLTHVVLRAKTQGLIVIQETLLIGVPMFLGSLCVDSIFYGKLEIIQWNFFKLNVLDGHSVLYGSKPWYWYWFEGVAVLLGTHLPILLFGMWLCRRCKWWSLVPMILALWVLFFHSLLIHKEHRFIFPVLPLANIYVGYGIWWSFEVSRSKALHTLVTTLLIASVPVCLYFSIVHQRGSLAVMNYLRNDLDTNSSVIFLMPCHTTPFYSHIHKPVQMEFLECPPPIGPEWVDISKEFYSAPLEWLQKKYSSDQVTPTHFVLFDYLVPVLDPFMKKHGYKEIHREFHTNFPESRRSRHIVVLVRSV